jgi:tetratricopeptide (TPR) repeat protein
VRGLSGGQTEVRQLEDMFFQDPQSENLSLLLDSYLVEGDPRSLEKALSLILDYLPKFDQDPIVVDRAIQVLSLIRNNPQAAEMVLELANRLVTLEPNEPDSYLNASYACWRLGRFGTAIELSERGLARSNEAAPTDDVVLQLKANLAYYYAQRGFQEDAEKSRAFAAEAYERGPNPNRADTLGYVYLQYAVNEQDLIEAIRYFEKAEAMLWENGRSNPLVSQHLQYAKEKMVKLRS